MIQRVTRNGRYLLSLAVLVLVALGTLAWLERAPLLAWVHVRLLIQASLDNREARAARVAALGEAAVPGLLECLQRNQPFACLNARAGLDALVHQNGRLKASETTDLAGKLSRDFAHFSPAGQRQVLEMVAGWMHNEPGAAAVAGLLPACGRFLSGSGGGADGEVQTAALNLCLVLGTQAAGNEVLCLGRDLVRACLQAKDAEVRVKAIQVGMQPGLDLLETVAGLLQDPDVRVRQAAIVAVGPADPAGRKAVLDEVLLPGLRDADPEVRRLTEAALRSRGLGTEHLELARLLIDPQPAQRMRVLDHLRRANDLDPGIWLRRLSQDPAPAVRAAVIRVMGQQTTVDLTDRLEQMAQSDPSPTVSYLAGFYLKVARTLQSGQGNGLPWFPGEGGPRSN